MCVRMSFSIGAVITGGVRIETKDWVLGKGETKY
jgi:hypothetical protein